jgi:hypothetical protein
MCLQRASGRVDRRDAYTNRGRTGRGRSRPLAHRSTAGAVAYFKSEVVPSFAFLEQSPYSLFEPLALPWCRLQPSIAIDQKNPRISRNRSVKSRHPGCGSKEWVSIQQ